ncbi:PREDICTED: basic leucine zipper 34 [Fragaria vesca subsp. vesca]|uniref:basic leucine zipper 34 n=1 Tax=Fragaria vesca subsp. vesca TaxID=101020 RepID=UPI0002C3365F|nr:PREDICTED: basic leucine zipper 34 [Fragaria vesca subsp. vesca]XP_011466942.1 PREDICTED: basic leucine zipper 34 [Fragaria vesca subsp. vesca]
MAQLPPKVPNMTPNWPDLSHHHKMSSCFAAPNGNAGSNPCWVDEFLDFSSARRGSHRRSVSDSITFLEAPMQDECRVSGAPPEPNTTRHVEFDRFDDEQFMSMFTTDEIAAAAAAGPTGSCSNPSTPSDHNSINDDEQQQIDDGDQKKKKRDNKLKHESEEAESECKLEGQQNQNGDNKNTTGDRKIDPKRVKRILANRQSAQRSRVRKLQYISELERSVTSLQAEVSVLSPRVAFLDHQRLLLNVDNSALKQRIAALAQDKIFKDAHQEALKREIERLRQVYHQQNLKKMEDNNNNNIEQSPNSDTITTQLPDAAAADQKEQLLNVSS